MKRKLLTIVALTALSSGVVVGQTLLDDINENKSTANTTAESIEENMHDVEEEVFVLQDELVSQVQELIENHLNPKNKEKLDRIEELMIEVTANLEEGDTSAKTIAAETEIIEMIKELIDPSKKAKQ